MNSVNMVGNLTADPKVRVTPEGKTITNATVAVQRPMVKDKTDFINIVAFGKTAELIADYFKKGHKIGISGVITTRNYETDDGRRVFITEVVANQIDFLNPKSQEAPKSDSADEFEKLGRNIGTDDEIQF